MSDFKKILKLTTKRLSIWLVLICLFFALVNALSSRNQIKVSHNNLLNSVASMEDGLGLKRTDLKNKKLDEDDIAYTKDLAEKYAEKYGLEKVLETKNYMEPANDWEKIQKSGVESQYFVLRDYIFTADILNQGRLLTSNIYQGLIATIVLMIGIFAMATTSVEESIGYYDFTMMLPWKKEKELFMKSAQAFIFGIIVFAINLAITSLMLKSSAFGQILSFSGFGLFILKALMVFMSASIIATATGLVAGNVIGHIGLLIISISGFELVRTLIAEFITVFSTGLASSFNQGYDSMKEKLPDYLKVFLSITHASYDDIRTLVSVLVVAILIGVCAYIIIKRSAAERSGYMVKNKTVSNICKGFAIFSLTSILYSFSINIFDANFLLASVVMYGLSFLLSFKFFDILFNIRLKF